MLGTMDEPFRDSVADCTVCLDLNKDYLRRQWRDMGRLPALGASYSLTINRLAESASSTGCNGCALILNAAQEIQKEYELDFRNVILEFLDNERQGLSLTLTMLHPLHTKPGDWEKAQANSNLKVAVHTGPSTKSPNREWEHKILSPTFEIFYLEDVDHETATHETSKALRSSLIPRPSRCGDTGGDKSVTWTLSNLRHCCSNHLECNLEEPDWGLPTRILDLGERNEVLTSSVKLYVTRKEQEQYLCLSHCWGSDEGLKPIETTRETLPDFQKGIPYENLPKTFQDAVVFTRKLGYRFLWIDSLRIIQNDEEDWMREAGEMASIYENADLTLAAASSDNSSGGLFRSGSPEIRLTGRELEEFQPALRQFSNPLFFQYRRSRPKRARPDPDDTSPLLQRAWVFQERILSRRVVFFTPLELVFECRVSNSTESGYSWVDSQPKHVFKLAYDVDVPSDTLTSLWRGLVTDFTHLQLTMEKDTLPGMAGLAKRFLQRSEGADQSAYCAGMWRDTFLEDMLWKASPHKDGRPHRTNPSIPTWSWARSDEPKSYVHTKYLTHLCQLEDVTCIPKGSSKNTLVSIDSGHVVLSGYLLSAKETSMGVAIDRNPRVRHIPDRDFNWFEEGPDKINDGDNLCILPVATSSDADDNIHIHALILRPSNECSSAFTRIGVFSISFHHLQQHPYIFEGTNVALNVYQSLISYGESLLEAEGSYREAKKGSSKPLPLAPDSEKRFSSFEMKARYIHLCLYGNRPDVNFDEFFGQMHLDVLRSEMAIEQERIAEWHRRTEMGEDQVHQRVSVKIV